MDSGEHIMEMLGKTRVKVRNGKVIEIGEPLIKYCPLFHELCGIKEITKEEVLKNIERRMRSFGLFSVERIVEDERPLTAFGISEILFSCLRRNFLDAVVIAADCAGSVITSNPRLVQGLGGRISGIIKTSPIPEVMRRIEQAGGIIVDRMNAEIDQVKGVKLAMEKGYKRIGVTLTSSDDARACKLLEEGDKGIKILKIAVHTTGVQWNLEEILCFDLITLCASRILRERLSGIAKAQAGRKIPVIAVSDFGKEALLERAMDLDNLLIVREKIPCTESDQPYPLI